LEKIGKKNRFKRVFVALKPCIDGFLAGCRPFVGVDASFMNGKYTGQLASATGVDGHNWLTILHLVCSTQRLRTTGSGS